MAVFVHIGILAGNGDDLVATSQEELAKKGEHVQKLREQVAAEEAKRLERESGLANEITAQQLDAEAARLEAQLAMAKQANRASAVKEGASGPLAAAKAEMEAAVAQQKAAEAASKSEKED